MADSPNSDFSFAALTGNSALIDQTLTRVFQSLSRNIRTGTGIRIGDISQTFMHSLVPLSGVRAGNAPDGGGQSYLMGDSVAPTYVGTIMAGATSGSPQRTFNTTARDDGSLLRSQEQIAAQLLKALLRGKRNL